MKASRGDLVQDRDGTRGIVLGYCDVFWGNGLREHLKVGAWRDLKPLKIHSRTTATANFAEILKDTPTGEA